MRSLLLGVPLLAAAAVLQSAVLPHFRVLAGGGLDLTLVLVLAWTLAGDWQGGAAWGFLGGLFLDLLSSGPLGLNTLALVLMTYLASLTEGQFWRSHVLLPLAAALLGGLGYHALTLAGLAAAGHAINWGEAVVGVTLPSILLDMLAIVPVYQVMRGLQTVVFPAPVKR